MNDDLASSVTRLALATTTFAKNAAGAVSPGGLVMLKPEAWFGKTPEEARELFKNHDARIKRQLEHDEKKMQKLMMGI